MINLHFLPCSNCVSFNGIKQPKGKEKGEYVGCKFAKNGNAESVFSVSDKAVFCKHQEKEEN